MIWGVFHTCHYLINEERKYTISLFTEKPRGKQKHKDENQTIRQTHRQTGRHWTLNTCIDEQSAQTDRYTHKQTDTQYRFGNESHCESCSGVRIDILKNGLQIRTCNKAENVHILLAASLAIVRKWNERYRLSSSSTHLFPLVLI